MAVMVGHDLPLSEISGPHRAPPHGVGLVQFPTTAGTGSEVATRALITDPVSRSKIAYRKPSHAFRSGDHRRLRPTGDRTGRALSETRCG
ncbi:iron-containing alcohol dehydrogenase [Puniceibacterium sediminis]|uniref:iron-containing alcohol dehydrogenase n=1 Tax=Puniceibacterium sediminis TaxID=1608407 RepID=UPI002481C34E|nr:iron-containing alcohol dehydrogenase [Puniceibacterium sediminis]